MHDVRNNIHVQFACSRFQLRMKCKCISVGAEANVLLTSTFVSCTL